MADNAPVKRGRGRPPKYTAENPKPKRDMKNPLEVIRKPSSEAMKLPGHAELPEGDNTKFTTFALAIMQLPAIDLHDPEEVQQRVYEYFSLCAEHDMKPGVSAVGLALGLDRRRLWEIHADQPKQPAIPKECKRIIKQVYNGLDVLWESWMQSGKINPVSGIFLGKNHFGYRDQQEYVVTPKTSDDYEDPDVIEAKYDELPD